MAIRRLLFIAALSVTAAVLAFVFLPRKTKIPRADHVVVVVLETRHNSLLIVTFDEDDYGAENHIPTIMYGAQVRPGRYAGQISHYNVLRTLLDMYELPAFAEAAAASPILDVWQ